MSEGIVAALEKDLHELAEAIVVRMERAKPNLYDRYGPQAKDRTAEDVKYHLQHLEAALDIEDPQAFVDYREWLERVLLPRGILMEDIELNWDAMIDELRSRYGEKADLAVEYLEGSRSDSG